jgi:hypothetical protein
MRATRRRLRLRHVSYGACAPCSVCPMQRVPYAAATDLSMRWHAGSLLAR